MATDTFNFFDSAAADFGNGVISCSGGGIKFALTNTAPNASDSQLSDITQIAYTNITGAVAGKGLTPTGVTAAGNPFKFDHDDTDVAATGPVATFRYVVWYDDNATNDELIGWVDYGAGLTLADTEKLIVRPNASNGVFGIS